MLLLSTQPISMTKGDMLAHKFSQGLPLKFQDGTFDAIKIKKKITGSPTGNCYVVRVLFICVTTQNTNLSSNYFIRGFSFYQN